MDFSTRAPGLSPLFVTNVCAYSCLGQFAQGVNGITNLSFTVNTVYFSAFYLPGPFYVQRFMMARNTAVTATVNYDMGVYSADEGELLVSTGSTSVATPGSGSPITFINAATPTLLAPGRYYFGWMSATGGAAAGAAIPTRNQAMLGIMKKTVAGVPLPTTMTSAARNTDGTYPYVGITQTTT